MDEALDAILATDDTAELKAAGVTHSGALRGVMGQLKAGGMSVVEIIKLIPLIVDLIQEYGPVVAEIVKKVREKFAAN
jgi:hypothetical protein